MRSIIKYGFYGSPENIEIGEYVYIGENCHFWAFWGIHIGKWSVIAPNVIIRTSNHDYKTGDYLPFWPWVEKKAVCIWENCWIGANVLIVPGSSIWEGSIIGFWSVVSWDIPPCSIVVGNPWKVIKMRDEKKYKELQSQEKIYYKNF